MSEQDRSDTPRIQKVGSGTRWRYSQPEKKALRDPFDKRVILGPRWAITHMQCQDHGPRQRVQGRWLSAVWASRIRWVSKAIKYTQAHRRDWQCQALKTRLARRFSSGESDLPF